MTESCVELVFSCFEYKLDSDVTIAKLHGWVLLCFGFHLVGGLFLFLFLEFQDCTLTPTCAGKGPWAVPEPFSLTSSHHYIDLRCCFSKTLNLHALSGGPSVSLLSWPPTWVIDEGNLCFATCQSWRNRISSRTEPLLFSSYMLIGTASLLAWPYPLCEVQGRVLAELGTTSSLHS